MRRSVIQWALAQWVLAGAAGFSAVASGATFHTDDFQSGSPVGWIGNLFGPPTVEATGGPDGAGDAFLLVSASNPTGPGAAVATHNSSPVWVGDYGSLDAGFVTVDLMNPTSSSVLEMRLVLFSEVSPVILGERWTSTSSTVVANDGVWRNYQFGLAEADFTQVLGTSTYDVLIGDVRRVMLRHNAGDPFNGGTPTFGSSLGIDNVSLVANPPVLTADFNADGQVDGDDLNDAVDGWQARFGTDLTGSSFLQWQQQFGSGVPLLAATLAVPEPSTSLLCMVLAVLAAGRRTWLA